MLRIADDIDRPVDVVRQLTGLGLSLRRAHDTMNRLASGEAVPVAVVLPKKGDALAELARLGVAARPIRRPQVDVRAARERLGLTQAEFAIRFGFELDTVQNWEQGRNTPDAPTQVLLKVIETRPDIVDDVLSARS